MPKHWRTVAYFRGQGTLDNAPMARSEIFLNKLLL